MKIFCAHKPSAGAKLVEEKEADPGDHGKRTPMRRWGEKKVYNKKNGITRDGSR